MREDYDVVVVGAGFGGLVAAKKCADAGLKVLVVERGEEVGDKIVSGCTIPIYGFLFGPDFIRNGDPPIERPCAGIRNYLVKNVDADDYEVIENVIPQPLSPVIVAGYNIYCKPFCQWMAEQVVKAGVELRTSTVAKHLIKEGGEVKGIITDEDEKITSKIVLDCEGHQGLLAVEAGLRDKWAPETIALASAYDYEMNSARETDEVFGFVNEFLWAWDENKVAPPLGYGNGLMIFPYDSSFHYMQDQCLKVSEVGGPGYVPDLRRLLDEYHKSLTSKWRRWKNEIEPHIRRLRGLVYDTFEIFVALHEKQRNIPLSTSGLMLVGDAAGLESTELCDGIPTAWFSAEYAAEVAIEAIKRNDTSAQFLKKYDQLVRSDKLIRWATSGRDRHNLRLAQRYHDIELFRWCIYHGFGPGAWSNPDFRDAFISRLMEMVREVPDALEKIGDMFARNFINWRRRGHVINISYTNEDMKSAWNEFLIMLGIPAGARDLLKPIGDIFIRAAKEGLG
jgi:electron transfer flavoprotein-quinone oxidoreductase